jgi:hypothetical protein
MPQEQRRRLDQDFALLAFRQLDNDTRQRRSQIGLSESQHETDIEIDQSKPAQKARLKQ